MPKFEGKEHPILFSGEMVRAILDGRKTQTRRVVRLRLNKKQKEQGFPEQPLDILPMPNPRKPSGKEWVALMRRDPEPAGCVVTYPSLAGDRLWVRESWNAGKPATPSGTGIMLPEPKPQPGMKVIYRATSNYGDDEPPWRPSIHMPRWASRLTLEVLSVRVERIQEISIHDAISEGAIGSSYIPNTPDYQKAFDEAVRTNRKPPLGENPKQRFARLWDSINSKRGYGWDSNPWVWVIEFKRIDVE